MNVRCKVKELTAAVVDFRTEVHFLRTDVHRMHETIPKHSYLP
jgi:hypothetical protein